MSHIYQSSWPAPKALPLGNLFDLVSARAVERPQDVAFHRHDGMKLT